MKEHLHDCLFIRFFIRRKWLNRIFIIGDETHKIINEIWKFYIQHFLIIDPPPALDDMNVTLQTVTSSTWKILLGILTSPHCLMSCSNDLFITSSLIASLWIISMKIKLVFFNRMILIVIFYMPCSNGWLSQHYSSRINGLSVTCPATITATDVSHTMAV